MSLQQISIVGPRKTRQSLSSPPCALVVSSPRAENWIGNFSTSVSLFPCHSGGGGGGGFGDCRSTAVVPCSMYCCTVLYGGGKQGKASSLRIWFQCMHPGQGREAFGCWWGSSSCTASTSTTSKGGRRREKGPVPSAAKTTKVEEEEEGPNPNQERGGKTE